MGPILVTRAKLLAYLPIFFFFLIFPSPFSPVTLLKHKPEPIKISQASLPHQDRHQWTTPISPTCTAAWSPLSWPSGANKHKEMWPISPFLSRMISSDPRQCYLIPFCTLSTCFYLICVFHIWVLRKLLGFSLNSICLCFFLLSGWWKNNKGEVVLVFFFFLIWYYCAYPLLVCFNGLKYIIRAKQAPSCALVWSILYLDPRIIRMISHCWTHLLGFNLWQPCKFHRTYHAWRGPNNL